MCLQTAVAYSAIFPGSDASPGFVRSDAKSFRRESTTPARVRFARTLWKSAEDRLAGSGKAARGILRTTRAAPARSTISSATSPARATSTGKSGVVLIENRRSQRAIPLREHEAKAGLVRGQGRAERVRRFRQFVFVLDSEDLAELAFQVSCFGQSGIDVHFFLIQIAGHLQKGGRFEHQARFVDPGRRVACPSVHSESAGGSRPILRSSRGSCRP